MGNNAMLYSQFFVNKKAVPHPLPGRKEGADRLRLFQDKFSIYKKAGEPLYKTPKSVQECIEILKIAPDGIFEVAGNRYSKSYLFSDVNYNTTSETEQVGIFESYCKFLNAMDVEFKVTINNKNRNMKALREKVLFQKKSDGNDAERDCYNQIMEKKIVEGKQGIEQERYLTVSIIRKNYEEAKAAFASLEAVLQKGFGELGSSLVTLDGVERLRVLHDFYRMEEEEYFAFGFDEAVRVSRDYKDDICNSMLKFYPTYMQDEKRFARALFIKKYPSSLSDRFLTELATVPAHTIISIDVAPIPKDVTTSTLQKKYMGIESDIIRQQRVRNKNNDFSSDISYNKRMEKQQIEEIMDDVRENDQRLFYVAVTIVIKADTKEELEAIEETLVTIGKRNSCQIEAHYLKQREALNTALPIGVRQVETMRTLMTQSLAHLHAKSANVQDYVKEAVEREVYSEEKKYIENISELCRYNSQNPEHIYDITNAVIQSAQYMAAVRMDVKSLPVSSLLPVLATAPRLMVYGLCNTALSVAGQVLTGIEKAFERKKEKQRAAEERAEDKTEDRKEQEIGGKYQIPEWGNGGYGIPALRNQPHQNAGPHKRQGNGSRKGTETAGYEQLSLSFDGGYVHCDCGRAL